MDEPDVWLTNPECNEEVHDAITGAQLDPSLVAKVRNAELTFLIDQLNAFKYDTVDNCLKTTGRRPIPVKWVDVNKGDTRRPEVRSRLTVAETSTGPRSRLRTTRRHSRTPPCEALRWSFVMSLRDKEDKSHVLMFIDITWAHPHCSMR